MADLLQLHCKPQHGENPLTQVEISPLLATLNGWSINDDTLIKTFHFPNYYTTMAFVNALAWIAHREDHHPDLSVHYNRVIVQWSTHDAGGLTLNDFICAAKVETLMVSET